MKQFILTFFCSFLSSGKLETISDANNFVLQPNTDSMSPVIEEYIWPVRAYDPFRNNFYATGRRSINSRLCPKNNQLQDIQLEQPNVPPTRRASPSVIEKHYLTNYNPRHLKPLGSQDNTFIATSNEEILQTPESITNDGNTSENQEILTESNSASAEDHIEDNGHQTLLPATVQDISPLLNHEIPESTPVINSEKPESLNSQFPKDKVVSGSAVTVETPELQTHIQCTDKTESKDLTEPPRRSLAPTYNGVSNDQTNKNDAVPLNSYINKPLDINTYNKVTKLLSVNDNPSIASTKYPTSIRNVNEQQTSNTLAKSINTVNEKPGGRAGRVQYVTGNNKFSDPANGQGITKKAMKVMLMDFDRVCYACSSANNPTCLSPDRRTTVKYCRKGNNACVTKSFGAGSTLTLIRDCGKTCDDAEIAGLIPKYKSCSICHSDLCNGAYTPNVHSLILALPTILLIVLGKLV